MSAGNHVSLLALADRELPQLAAKRPVPPVNRKVKPIKLNVAKFDRSWDRKRGAALRPTGVRLRDDDSALERRVCVDERSVKTYANAANGFQRESANLRRIARLLDTAGSRLTAVLSRCHSAASRPNSTNQIM
jgi:hypothetical protein